MACVVSMQMDASMDVRMSLVFFLEWVRPVARAEQAWENLILTVSPEWLYVLTPQSPLLVLILLPVPCPSSLPG